MDHVGERYWAKALARQIEREPDPEAAGSNGRRGSMDAGLRAHTRGPFFARS